MATAIEPLLTAEEYGQLADNGQRTELLRGRIMPLNMPYPRHGEICANTAYLVRRYLDDHDNGRVVTNDSGVVTERNPDTVRGADVAFYSYQRVPKGPLPRRYLDVSPDVIFEVRSPADTWPEIFFKVGEYLRAQVKVVCVLDEVSETITVCRENQPPQVLKADDELTLPDLLPGFRVQVRSFFE
jgi:Uma2 family endonuclease